MNPYETQKLLSEYLLFHYGAAEEIMPYDFGPAEALHYPVRTVTECIEPRMLPPASCALDLGCAVGRSTFELARICREVIGIDFSQSFVDAANQLRERGRLDYEMVVEGDQVQKATAAVPEEIDRSRVRFEHGDACQLREGLPRAHVVHMANLIDRLPDPERCLRQMGHMVLPNGHLIITSPYTWLEEYTPRGKWVGTNGSSTLNAMRSLLQPDFLLVRRFNMPFLIREHARKFQWSVAEATVWKRT